MSTYSDKSDNDSSSNAAPKNNDNPEMPPSSCQINTSTSSNSISDEEVEWDFKSTDETSNPTESDHESGIKATEAASLTITEDSNSTVNNVQKPGASVNIEHGENLGTSKEKFAVRFGGSSKMNNSTASCAKRTKTNSNNIKTSKQGSVANENIKKKKIHDVENYKQDNAENN